MNALFNLRLVESHQRFPAKRPMVKSLTHASRTEKVYRARMNAMMPRMFMHYLWFGVQVNVAC